MHAPARALILLAIPAALSAAPLGPAAAAPDTVLPLLEEAGARALRLGDGPAALAELDKNRQVADTAFYCLKRGLALAQSDRSREALHWLQRVAAGSSPLAACAAEQSARLFERLDQPDSALACYRVALSQPLPERYQTELRNAVSALLITRRIDPAEHAWVSTWFTPAPLLGDSAQVQVVGRLLADHDWLLLDSVVGLILDSSSGSEACRLFALMTPDSVPDSVLATSRLFEAAQRLYACGRYDEAKAWLERALHRGDFGDEVLPKRSLYLRGMLAYRLGRCEDAVGLLRKFDREYGPTAELVLTVARCYRSLGRGARAAEWYDRHIALFPGSTQSQEILWYRAWQREEAGQLAEAAQLYRRLRQQYRRGPRAADALFREGLLDYKRAAHDSALAAWQTLVRAWPQSPLTTAARYWQARALFSLQRAPEAHEVLLAVVAADPLDFYAYRALDALHQMGDTTAYVVVDETRDMAAARAWLDSLSAEQRGALSAEDSATLRAGTLLTVAGLSRQADLYLDELVKRRSTDLLLEYDVAALYAHCGYPTLCYRAARALGWRIAPQDRDSMPLALHTLLYPPSYAELIQSEAVRRGVEPSLVSAVIRQESMFDPAIVSPAGAVGLMQIMPATGRAIASELGEAWAAESLASATANVRYGVYYVRQLLEQFEGNMVLALAGYNGGPHNAKRWFESNRNEAFDLFIEDIAFSETRGYVKRVLANYWAYNRLARLRGYGAWPAGSLR